MGSTCENLYSTSFPCNADNINCINVRIIQMISYDQIIKTIFIKICNHQILPVSVQGYSNTCVGTTPEINPDCPICAFFPGSSSYTKHSQVWLAVSIEVSNYSLCRWWG